MGLQYSITAIGTVILQSSVNMLGSLAVAATTAASKVNMLSLSILDALGAAMATYGGQNLVPAFFYVIHKLEKAICVKRKYRLTSIKRIFSPHQ